MFQLHQPTAAAVDQSIAAVSHLPATPPRFLTCSGSLTKQRLRPGWAHDLSKSQLGAGASTFRAARDAFRHWVPFDLGWTVVANSSAPIQLGQIVAVRVCSLGLWSLNLSRIVDLVDSETHFGFVYATTPHHVEEGEERFLLELDPATGTVTYSLEAVSHPHALFARIGYPITRHFQHKFAHDSLQRLKREVESSELQSH